MRNQSINRGSRGLVVWTRKSCRGFAGTRLKTKEKSLKTYQKFTHLLTIIKIASFFQRQIELFIWEKHWHCLRNHTKLASLNSPSLLFTQSNNFDIYYFSFENKINNCISSETPAIFRGGRVLMTQLTLLWHFTWSYFDSQTHFNMHCLLYRRFDLHFSFFSPSVRHSM